MLKIKNVDKLFDDKKVLDNVSLEVEKGKVLSILGPNGSGKTTLLKIISTLLRPSNDGYVEINGKRDKVYLKKSISFLMDRNILDEEMKIVEILNLYLEFFEDFDLEKAKNLLDKLKLNLDSSISALSKGDKEKLSLIISLSRNVKVYILDEPISGVDLVSRIEILNLITENLNEDSILIITTHLISEIEHIFDEVVFIKNGKLSEVYDVEKVRSEYNKSIEELYLEFFGKEVI